MFHLINIDNLGSTSLPVVILSV